MKELSSNILYYKALATLIIFPFLIAGFSELFWVNNFSNTAIVVIYIITGIFCVSGFLKILRYRQVFYQNDRLIFKTYFTNKLIEITFDDVITLEEKMFIYPKNKPTGAYKLIYKYGEKNCEIYFYKSLALYTVSDIANYIGVKNNE